MSRQPWHRTIGAGAARATGADGVVAVRPAWNGGVRIVVSRHDGGGIYLTTHARHVAWLTYSPRRGADA